MEPKPRIRKPVLSEEEKFYQTLYDTSSINTERPESNAFLKNKLIKPLRDESANVCEGKINKEERLKALLEMESDKSPGSDGFTSEFCKRFLG